MRFKQVFLGLVILFSRSQAFALEYGSAHICTDQEGKFQYSVHEGKSPSAPYYFVIKKLEGGSSKALGSVPVILKKSSGGGFEHEFVFEGNMNYPGHAYSYPLIGIFYSFDKGTGKIKLPASFTSNPGVVKIIKTIDVSCKLKTVEYEWRDDSNFRWKIVERY